MSVVARRSHTRKAIIIAFRGGYDQLSNMGWTGVIVPKFELCPGCGSVQAYWWTGARALYSTDLVVISRIFIQAV